MVMAEKKDIPFIIKVHNATCPVWLFRLNFLKKIEPGCGLAAEYVNSGK